MADPVEPMRVWPNRVPHSLVERWAERAREEGTNSSAMLRHVMETTLATARPIMPSDNGRNPPTEVAPESCPHPKGKRRPLGYATVCTACNARVR